MSEFIVNHYWSCESNRAWKAYSGHYTVRFSENHKNVQDVIYDYSCNCPAYKYRSGYCKHIIEQEKNRCGWDQFLHGGELIDGRCPKCGNPVFSVAHWEFTNDG